LLVVGGQGSAKIVPTACNQAWQKGYNDGQNDFKAGKSSNDLANAISPVDDYRAGYS
jgi:hypothetical protein